MNKDRQNFVLFAVIAALILFGWPFVQNRFFPTANPPVTKIEKGKTQVLPKPGADPTADSPAATRTREAVLRDSPRVAIDTPRLKGSINLKGARIDDLVLVDYKETIAKNAAPIRLLSPAGAPDAYFTGFGWRDDGLAPPAGDTVWTASAAVLKPGQPVRLDATNARGLRFRIELSVDRDYLFAVRQTVLNTGLSPVPVATYGYVTRTGVSKDPSSMTIHVGPMSVDNGGAHYRPDFKDLKEDGPVAFQTTGGWLGFTDKYWLTALIPDQGARFDGQFRAGPNDSFQGDYSREVWVIARPGASSTGARL